MRIRFLAEEVDAIGTLTQVSRAGLSVKAEELPRKGAVIALQFRSPAGDLVDLRGVVRWNSDDASVADGEVGFGVMLHEPAPEYREFMLWAQEQLQKKEELGSDEL